MVNQAQRLHEYYFYIFARENLELSSRVRGYRSIPTLKIRPKTLTNLFDNVIRLRMAKTTLTLTT